MIDGFTPWPEADVAKYIESGVWTNETFADATSRWASRWGDHTALVHRDRKLTFSSMHEEVEFVAAGLFEIGLRAEDRVVLQLPNSAEFVVAALAMFRIGVIPVFSLASHRDKEIDHLVRVSGAIGYICPVRYRGYDYAELGERIRSRSDSLRHIILAGNDTRSDSRLDLPRGDPKVLPNPAADAALPAFFLLSGGTTALPKLIARTHRDYIYQIRTAANVASLSSLDVYLAALPVEFNFAWGCPGILGTFERGGTVVIADTPSPDECFDLIETYKVTITSVVPTVAVLWVDAQEWEKRAMRSLSRIQVGGARLDPKLAVRIQEVLQTQLMQVFGMAEGLLSMTRLNDNFDVIVGTQGTPISPYDEIVVVDSDGNPTARGVPGELLARGPYTLRGYFCAPEYNDHAFTSDGFLRTGDQAYITSIGNLVISGRIKDVIIRGGEKINAAEIEEQLIACPGVTAAASVAVPDELLGEKHYVFLVGDSPPGSIREIRSWLIARGLAEFKIPDRMEVVKALPLTSLGKVDKKALVVAALNPDSVRSWNISPQLQKDTDNA